LRREGIYSSMLCEWRRQCDDGAIKGLTPCRRGPQPEPVNPLDGEVARLRRENARLKDRLARAEQILDIQKKVSEMLAIPLKTASDDESI
jgi:transposase-like protein